jgi:membrane protease YdiL (CAAX protease family)
MHAPGIIFLLVTCLLFPYAAIRSAFRVRKVAAGGRTITRAQHLASIAVTQGFSFILALSAARYEDIELFPAPHPKPGHVLVAAAFLVIALGTIPARWALKPRQEKDRIKWIYPHAPRDLWWWAVIALIAGTVEEIVFRGVTFALWMRLLHSWWLAASVCVAVFTVAHFVQGWRAMAVIALLSLGMHGIVWYTGDLYTAMAVHAVYDMGAGMIVMWILRREGLVGGEARAPA